MALEDAQLKQCRYVAIATDRPLDTGAMVQDGMMPGGDPTACGGGGTGPTAEGDRCAGPAWAEGGDTGLRAMTTREVAIREQGCKH